MDIQRLRETALRLLKTDMSEDCRYFVENMATLLSDAPLDLDRAKAVMGREPDKKVGGNGYRCHLWGGADVVRIIFEKKHFIAEVGDWTQHNPTIGQFALLVAAGRIGGQS